MTLIRDRATILVNTVSIKVQFQFRGRGDSVKYRQKVVWYKVIFFLFQTDPGICAGQNGTLQGRATFHFPPNMCYPDMLDDHPFLELPLQKIREPPRPRPHTQMKDA